MPGEKPEVVVTDLKIPFWSMVVLMVKWAIAAIPAVIVLFLIFAALGAVKELLFGAGWQWWGGGRWM